MHTKCTYDEHFTSKIGIDTAENEPVKYHTVLDTYELQQAAQFWRGKVLKASGKFGYLSNASIPLRGEARGVRAGKSGQGKARRASGNCEVREEQQRTVAETREERRATAAALAAQAKDLAGVLGFHLDWLPD